MKTVRETKYPGIERFAFAFSKLCPRLLDRKAVDILIATAKEAADRVRPKLGMPLALIIVPRRAAGAGFAKPGGESQLRHRADHHERARAGVATNRRPGAQLRISARRKRTGFSGASAEETLDDVVLAVLGNKTINGTVTDTRLAARKQRSGPKKREFQFSARTICISVNRYGADITSQVIDLGAGAKERPSHNDGSCKSLRLLRQTLMNVLVDHGTEQRQFADGPLVRAVDIEIVRSGNSRIVSRRGRREGQTGRSTRKPSGAPSTAPRPAT